MSYSESDIARVVHEANRALQIVQDDPTISVSPSYDDLDPETKASAIEGVRGVLAGNTPEESHQSWLRFKQKAGWVYGPVKDAALRTHPLMVDCDALSDEAKVKDALFVAIVNALAVIS